MLIMYYVDSSGYSEIREILNSLAYKSIQSKEDFIKNNQIKHYLELLNTGQHLPI